MKKIISLLSILLLAANSFAQGHFVLDFIGNGQDHMNIYVISATLGGFNLQAGDEIAVFDDTICCGKAILTQPILSSNFNTFASIAASRADDGLPNGFTQGHPITFKYWDESNGKEYSNVSSEFLNPTTGLPVTSPTFSNNGSAIVRLSFEAIINQKPLANAGSDQSVNEGDVVTLNGSGSSDPDANPITYLWTTSSGITLSSTTVANPSFTAPEVIADKTYTFSLTVSDGTLNSTTDQVVITVKQVNKKPISNAGSDQTINEGTLVSLNGSASADPDNDYITYLWSSPAGITLSSSSVAKPTFTAPEVTTDTELTFSLFVNDGLLNSTVSQVKITVKHVNKKPVAIAGPDQIVDEKSIVTLNGTASYDDDGNPLTYHWTVPNGISLIAGSIASSPKFKAPEVTKNTDYTILLVVNDGFTDSQVDEITITVRQVNLPPVANAGTDQSVSSNSLYTLDGSASVDPDHDLLTYRWTAPAGITLSSTSSAKPTFTSPTVTSNTNYTFTLVVNDGTVDSQTDQVTITVKQSNRVPVASAGSDQSIDEGSYVILDGSASFDLDDDALVYYWTAPEGIKLFSPLTVQPFFVAPEIQTDQKLTFTLVVNDGTVNSVIDEVVITIKQVNKAPKANAGNDFSIIENNSGTLDGTKSIDPDGDQLTYKWTAPSGITLNSTTNAKPTFSAPNVESNTIYTFSLVVNDGKLNSSSDQVIVTVKTSNTKPIARAGNDQTVNEGSVVFLDGSLSSDPENDGLSYLWTAPGEIILSSNTESNPIFTAPNVSADTKYTLNLIVNDGIVNSVADQIEITVNQINNAPVFTSQKSFTVTADQPFKFLLEASDLDNDQINFTIDQFPSALKIAPKTTNSAELSGILTNANAGENSYNFTISDGIASVKEVITIMVLKVDHAPYIKNSIPDIVVEKKAPTQIIDLKNIFADDDSGDILNYSVVSNTNIPVVNVLISGAELILIYSFENTGSSEIVIRASSNGKEVKSTFKVLVNLPTEIISLNSENEVFVYPNPSKGKIKIRFDQIPKSGSLISVYNISGKKISEITATEKETTLDLSGINPGLYLIKTDQSGTKTFKLVIE